MSLSMQCLNCRWFMGDNTCVAYLDEPGIPPEIRTGEHDHDEPFPGDRGYRYDDRMDKGSYPDQADWKVLAERRKAEGIA